MVAYRRVVRTCVRADVKKELDKLIEEGIKPHIVLKVSLSNQSSPVPA